MGFLRIIISSFILCATERLESIFQGRRVKLCISSCAPDRKQNEILHFIVSTIASLPSPGENERPTTKSEEPLPAKLRNLNLGRKEMPVHRLNVQELRLEEFQGFSLSLCFSLPFAHSPVNVHFFGI